MQELASDRQPVLTDERLRGLLRSGRRASGRMSQKTAAARAGISPVYWQKIESGAQRSVPAGTLAAMFLAAGVGAGQLRDAGHAAVAAALDALRDLAGAETTAEDHLAATPGASAEEIGVLQAVWLALRAKRTTDPFGTELQDTSRRDASRRDASRRDDIRPGKS